MGRGGAAGWKPERIRSHHLPRSTGEDIQGTCRGPANEGHRGRRRWTRRSDSRRGGRAGAGARADARAARHHPDRGKEALSRRHDARDNHDFPHEQRACQSARAPIKSASGPMRRTFCAHRARYARTRGFSVPPGRRRRGRCSSRADARRLGRHDPQRACRPAPHPGGRWVPPRRSDRTGRGDRVRDHRRHRRSARRLDARSRRPAATGSSGAPIARSSGSPSGPSPSSAPSSPRPCDSGARDARTAASPCSIAPKRRSPVALIGARSCDLHGIAVQDRILRDGAYPDPSYVARRQARSSSRCNAARREERASASR